MSDKHNKIDEQQLSNFFKEITEKVKCEEDPVLLNEYRKVFKKSVPLNLRSYVAAYMATKLVYTGRNFSAHHGRNRFERFDRKESFEQGSRPAPVEIPEDLAATIFISIGKNRKVYKKDIAGMIANECSLDRDRIGVIKVLENYSFVTLYKEDSDRVIEKLNGYDYRGRSLTVSYSKKRNGYEAESESSDNEFSGSENESVSDSSESQE